MRSYAKNHMYMWKSTAGKLERSTRKSTEWDVRLDVGLDLTVETIIDNIRASLDDILYVLVSGVELPEIKDTKESNQFLSTETHVHIALIMNDEKIRGDVLRMLRGPRKIADEYATPRSKKFLYAGWILHHTKAEGKMDPSKLCLFEYGTCPMDPINSDTCKKYVYMAKKYGTKPYLDRFDAISTMAECLKIEAKRERGWKRSIEELDAEIEELQRKRAELMKENN